jgi:hypothetical protein
MKISLCIPTRERADCLAACLRNVTSISDPDLEIIVSDNASTDHTSAVVAAFTDPRLTLIRTSRRVSQRQNFEHAIEAASGDYVMVIGDDDAVLTGQWPRLRTLLARHAPPALSWPALFYHWPGAEKRGGGGRLRLNRATLFGPAINRTSDEQLASIRQLERSREDRSPKLYHGLLSREVVSAIRAKSGNTLASGQIDAYISAAALPFLSSYSYVRHPFTMLAMGPRSGGSSIAAQHRQGDANDTAMRVALEAEADPVIEPLAMPFPVLGFYLLNGLEQANRRIYDGQLHLELPRYVSMITSQLEKVSAPARQHGLALLSALIVHYPQDEELMALLAREASRLKALPEPGIGTVWGAQWRRRLESLSLIEPGRIGIDLKPRGMAAVDGAARMADHLIGPSFEADEPDPKRRWRDSLQRAFRVIAFKQQPSALTLSGE